MRRHIMRTIMISESKAAVFHRKLTEVIDNAQLHSFEVDVQYSCALFPPTSVQAYSSYTDISDMIGGEVIHNALVLIYQYVE
ncbi:hypothetical protein [Paenibacillus campi]|uniref:hypothetical protein n=1 Tax=Paenibacillus campi TaxID=3106031 RepID=UPI002AFF48A1|nr:MULTISPECIES: hypothetical protein [unclassified Paenibacillus]